VSVLYFRHWTEFTLLFHLLLLEACLDLDVGLVKVGIKKLVAHSKVSCRSNHIFTAVDG